MPLRVGAHRRRCRRVRRARAMGLPGLRRLGVARRARRIGGHAMNWQFIVVIATGFGVLWVLHKSGQALTKLLEAIAAIAVVFLTLWLAVKFTWKAARWLIRHWRTTLTVLVVAAWLHWFGWLSLVITVVTVAAMLAVWRWRFRLS